MPAARLCRLNACYNPGMKVKVTIETEDEDGCRAITSRQGSRLFNALAATLCGHHDHIRGFVPWEMAAAVHLVWFVLHLDGDYDDEAFAGFAADAERYLKSEGLDRQANPIKSEDKGG